MRILAGLVLAALSARADTLLVLNKADATLAFVDASSLRVLAKIATGEGPHEVAVSADGRIALVANYGTGPNPGSTVSIVDVRARKELQRMALPGLWRPHGTYTVGSHIYFTAEGSRAVARYDVARERIDWISGTGQNGTHMIVVREPKVYTANIGSDSVSIFDLSAAPRAVDLKQIAVGAGPEGIDLSPDGRELWVASRTDGPLSIIDTAANKVMQSIALGTKNANRVKFTLDGKRVLISDPSSNVVLVYDAAARQLAKRIDTAEGPSGILLSSDGKRAFIACSGAGVVQMLDLETLSIAASIATGSQPDGMAWAKD